MRFVEMSTCVAASPANLLHLASKKKQVEKVAIWTPDKDLAQCVRGTRVVQIDGRRKIIRDAAAIREKFGVDPPLIPDLLALVGDTADGYPGIPRIGAKTAAQLLNRYGKFENFSPNILGQNASSPSFLRSSRRCAPMRETRPFCVVRITPLAVACLIVRSPYRVERRSCAIVRPRHAPKM